MTTDKHCELKVKHRRITGIGSALIDLLIHEEDDFLKKLGKLKGGMTLVPDQEIEAILKKTCAPHLKVPGGAACNTIVGVGMLGGVARFIGKRGNDDYGQFYEENLIKSNVEPVFEKSSTPTGRVLSVITPDAQRSMFTFLGASTEMEPAGITAGLFRETGIALMEGYLLFNPNLMMAALRSAKESGAMIALDLASFEVVEAASGILKNIIRDYVDILIANEDEAIAYTGITEEEMALEALAEDTAIAVLKLGARGSLISYGGTVFKIDAVKGLPAKDTTGAGDLWAAGFLYGLSGGYGIEKSGELASACGYEVCQVIGAQIPEDGWERIRRLLT